MDSMQHAQEADACQHQTAEGEDQKEQDGEGNEAAIRGRHLHRHDGKRPYRQRVYRQQFSYMDLTDDQCLQRLQFRKDLVTVLRNLLQSDLQPQTRLRTPLTIVSKVTIALNFYATGSFQAAKVGISNISQFAMHSPIRQMTNALFKMRRDYISFPMSRVKQLERQTGFVHIAGFPKVQDAIDYTHVALRAPQNTKMFRNRKGFHSFTVQLMCDHNRNIMAVDALCPGSSHNAFILRQIATRCIIEQTIRILKRRFRLDRSGGVPQYLPERVSLFVVVCCMLHNLAIMRPQPLEDEAAVPPAEEHQEEEEAQEHDAQAEEEEALEEDHDAGRRPRKSWCRHSNPAREVQNHLIAAHF
uniref:putative nuclease HARBI1 n=1 Tax=Pristiophorus japonicus TaxID=55135 RepID=UPI00398F69B9